MNNLHCPIIHGALQINLLVRPGSVSANSCCLRKDCIEVNTPNIWESKSLIPLRDFNLKNQWDNGCQTCRGNESAGLKSFRTGMLEKFGVHKNLSGPQRLDLMFDNSCNLACRSCGPNESTFWQKHLKENNIPSSASPQSKTNQMIQILKNLDLSNLEMVVFCGGETLLGQSYWEVADSIAELVPHAAEKLILSFQTNGTQKINQRNIETINKFHLVKLNISLDAVKDRFEYLRWPANWNQVTDNIMYLREVLPNNVMFLIEETISVLNLYYQHELTDWVKNNFSTNRLGDITNHTKHMAEGFMNVKSLSEEYVDSLKGTDLYRIIPTGWKESSSSINTLISTLDKFDKIRKENWRETFPEIAEFYKRFATSGI